MWIYVNLAIELPDSRSKCQQFNQVQSSSTERLPKKARAVLESRVCDGVPTKLLPVEALNDFRLATHMLELVIAGHSWLQLILLRLSSPHHTADKKRNYFGYCVWHKLPLRSSKRRASEFKTRFHDQYLQEYLHCLHPCSQVVQVLESVMLTMLFRSRHHVSGWAAAVVSSMSQDYIAASLQYARSVYFILLHFTSFYFILLRLTSFYFVLLHFTSFYFILLHFTSFYFILLHFTSFYFILLHFTSFYFILLPYTARLTLSFQRQQVIRLSTLDVFRISSLWNPQL